MKSCEEHVGGLTLVTLSDIGSNHRALLIPNQDAADYCIDGDDFVLAVSDGVGACAKAEIGSRNAVTACVQLFLRRKIDESALHTDSIAGDIIDEWRALLGTEKEDECCATLKAIFKIEQVIKAVSVGDGFVAVHAEISILYLQQSKPRLRTKLRVCVQL